MKKGFYLKCLNLLGWQLDNKVDIPKKCILCVAPHTSNWDLPIGLIAFKSLKKKPNYMDRQLEEFSIHTKKVRYQNF